MLEERYGEAPERIVVEYPPQPGLGDLSSPVAFEMARRLRRAPRAIAQELAEAGARVAVVATSQDRCQSVANELPGSGHAGYACDVSDSAACAQLITAITEALGPPEILVNNAGITRGNILLRMKDEQWQQVLDTNLSGAFYLIRSVARGMMKRRSGKIVNISSIVALTGNPGQSNYAAAKAAVIGMTRDLAMVLAPHGVRVNTISPGGFERGQPRPFIDAYAEEVPLGRMGRDGLDMKGAVVFLASDASSYITGHNLVLDGGFTTCR